MTPLSTGVGWIALALALVGGELAVLLWLVRRAWRIPLGPSCAVALALLVCAEALTMSALSWLGALTRPGLVVAHLAVVAGGAALLRRVGWRRAPRPGRPGLPAALVVPLVLLAALSALRYAPNSSDSMTYHLARVAHWIAQGSIGIYPTSSVRQSVMMPGAEYVLLALQLVSGTDRLAGLLQLAAYLVLILSAPALARLSGAPRRLAPWAAPLVAALPMAVLQASSTQNDLVAAALVVALVTTALRLKGATGPAPVATRVGLLAACGAAALVVKASALVVALPFVLLALARLLASRARPRLRAWPAALAVGVAIVAIVAGPELVRRHGAGDIASVVPVYPTFAEWADRGANVVRGVLHHLPFPAWTPDAVQPHLTRRGGSLLAGWPQLVPHEDVVGNPLQAAAVLAAALAAAVTLGRVPRRGRWAMGAAVGAWILVHATIRDNEYVARLQLPLFGLTPVFLAALPRTRAGGRGARAVAAVLSVAAACLGIAVGSSNALRPPLAARVEPIARDYYRHNDLIRDPQETALRVARSSGCRRLGLFMGESGWEYPLTWTALREGIEVRHVFGTAEWACLVYAEPSSFGYWNLPRAPVALDPAEWKPAAANAGGVFLYRRVAPAAPNPGAGGARGEPG